MKTLALLTAALAATPASAEIYTCRSDKGAELAVQFETRPSIRLAIHDGRKLTLLCGRGAQLARCGWLSDSFGYQGRLGTVRFNAESQVLGPARFRLQQPGQTAWTSYACRAADARMARRFRG